MVIIRAIGFRHCNRKVIGRVDVRLIEIMVPVVVDTPHCRICKGTMARSRQISIRDAEIRIIITIAVARVIESIGVDRTGGTNSLKSKEREKKRCLKAVHLGVGRFSLNGNC